MTDNPIPWQTDRGSTFPRRQYDPDTHEVKIAGKWYPVEDVEIDSEIASEMADKIF